MKLLACLSALPVVLLGCAAGTPPPNQPQAASTGEVAVIDLNATKAPDPAAKKEEAKPVDVRTAALKDAEEYGILGLLSSGDGQASGDASGKGDSAEARGNIWGDSIGDSYGVGGLGLAGVGTGGGRGEGIGIGSIGSIGAGSSTGQGFGSGSGRLGGATRTKPPQVRMGAVSVAGRLPPEVVQRIVRQNFGRFRLCYENGLRANANLQGRVGVKFVINKDGSTGSVVSSGSDLPDSGVVSCVVRAFNTLSYPEPEGGGTVTVIYPIMFSPPESAAPPPPPTPAPAPAPKAVAPAPAKKP